MSGQKGRSGGAREGAGRKTNEHSITYWIREFAALTPRALGKQYAEYAEKLKSGDDVLPMAARIALQALIDLHDEINPTLLSQVWDRLDGKVTDKLETTGSSEVVIRFAGHVNGNHNQLVAPAPADAAHSGSRNGRRANGRKPAPT